MSLSRVTTGAVRQIFNYSDSGEIRFHDEALSVSTKENTANLTRKQKF